ncbi:DNA-binding response regulator [Cohnella endophytica]|uniref:DNA-binding response regulator n=1 Tax=Cohnella endophytica TaxID=2419778 RepID=A0A494X8K8_9BACL|nr:response regulator transcription factor [Cohnella endophytica]RKP44494.1 DNA-binding response regulator [Cohnella endophytica]
MIRVLIVEDDLFWQDQLRHELGDEPDIDVLATVSGKDEALQFIQQHPTDVVLMDINLTANNLDGIEATRMIVRLMSERTKVIMLTSLHQSDIIVDSFRNGAINYITKSNYAHLVAAIREADQGKASIHADVADAVRNELKLSILTPMEREVYQMKAQGFNKFQIAEKLFKSVNTIKSQLKSIRDKLR